MESFVQNPSDYEFRTVIVWFRRDLRVDDNPALVAALSASAHVIPVFIWAPEEEGQFQPGRCSRWWTKLSLIDLQQALAALGTRLIIRRSTDSTAALLKVVAEVGAEAVFFNHLYDPISLMRDHDCKRGLTAAGVTHRTFNGDMLYEPWEILDSNEQPYSTFDDFWNSVKAMPVPPPFPVAAPDAVPPVSASVPSLVITEVDWFFTAEQEASSDQLKFKWKPGVGGAISELESFVSERLRVFEHDRAKVDRESSSRLSPWIHIGSISVRYIFYRVRQFQAECLAAGEDRSRSCDDFLQQIGYREYSRYLSFHFPFIHERSLLRHLRACPWRIDQHAFKAWRQGQTGYPIVDAAMRQLWSCGWCHNRARVVAASFLVKDLLLPWQWGLKHYWDAQIDADLECDALGWQYVSGGMSDAHPFSHMMDLESEARRFDPDGEYVRRWLPVLSRLPTEFIHAPWKAPPKVLAAADVELGCNYPAPIISRSDARANVEYACSVLDKCVMAESSKSSGRYPYRTTTFPTGICGGGASSGANPTGDGGGGDGGTRTGGGATGTHDGSAQHSHQRNVCGSDNNVVTTQYRPPGGAVSRGDGDGCASIGDRVGVDGDGGMSGQLQRRDCRSGSADGGDGALAAPASAPVSQVAVGAMGPLPPPPGGAVYYIPGDAAGQQMLDRILQQQQRARGAAAGHHDGSGTDRPQQPYHQEPQLQQQMNMGHGVAPAGPLGYAAGPDASAAADWADRVEAGEEDDEAVELWQQQQMLQGGTAAFAFEQAMQLLLARRRMGDGISIASGDRGDGEDPDGFDFDNSRSEEVVSNTVNLNRTAFTGASWHQNQAGTARGARQRGRTGSAARSGARRGGTGRAEDEAGGRESPWEGSPPRSAVDEADPLHDRDQACDRPESRAVRRRRTEGGAHEGAAAATAADYIAHDNEDEDMECCDEAEGGCGDGEGATPTEWQDGSPNDSGESEEEGVVECRLPQGGLARISEDGSGSHSSLGYGSRSPPRLRHGEGCHSGQNQIEQQGQELPHGPHGDPTNRYDTMEEDQMVESLRSLPPPVAWPSQQHDCLGCGGAAASAQPPLCAVPKDDAPRCWEGGREQDTEMVGVPPQQLEVLSGEGPGLHKRRRFASGSLGPE